MILAFPDEVLHGHLYVAHRADRTISRRVGSEGSLCPSINSCPAHPFELAHHPVVHSPVRPPHHGNSAPAPECDGPFADVVQPAAAFGGVAMDD